MSEQLFQGVEDTLFIPLAGRIYISKEFPNYFYDEKALGLAKQFQFQSIIDNSKEYSLLGSASRALLMDNTVISFLKDKELANVVCIGCGLETMSFRLNEYENQCIFYQIDFPSVIEAREKVLGVRKNEVLISGNANEIDFSTYMDCDLPTIFVVAGVFQYFQEEEVISLMKKMQESFGKPQIVFDAVDEFGMNYIKKYVKKTGNQSAMIYFCINSPEEFAKKSNSSLLSVTGFYGLVSKEMRKKLKLITKISMKVSDGKLHAKILHLQL